jgi:hypothetical protein
MTSHAPEPPFFCGEAGVVWVGGEGFVQTDTRVHISPNSLHALHGHGVVDRLNALRLEVGQIGKLRDAVIAPGDTPAALRIFYEADRFTYGAVHDLLVERRDRQGPSEYRLRVDNREFQRTLSQLQFMSSTAAHMGHGIRLRI